MKFQKERVFTTLNAFELKVGSKVFLANELCSLKKQVEREFATDILNKISGEQYERRFNDEYSLAYVRLR